MPAGGHADGPLSSDLLARLPELLTGVCGAVNTAARAVADHFARRDFEVSDKGHNDPLTTADLHANDILRERLAALLPAAGWLSEESSDDLSRLERELCWVVDPIDGTREFVAGVPEFSISVGLAARGTPVLGCVALPADDRIIYGCTGSGVHDYRYGQDDAAPLAGAARCALSARTQLTGCTVLVSRSEHRRGAFASVVDDFDLQPGGSIARKLALVAAGTGDLVVSLYPKNEWDICGGMALILAQAGGVAVELRTDTQQRFNRQATLTVGLAAGPRSLVRAFADYMAHSKLSLTETYS